MKGVMRSRLYLPFRPLNRNFTDNRSVWLSLCVIITIFLIVCISAITVWISHSSCDHGEHEVNMADYGMCCPCDGDLVGVFPEEQWERFGKKCCLKDAENINALLKVSKLRSSFEANYYDTNFVTDSNFSRPRPRPAAHMFIDPYRLYNHKELVWTTEPATAFMTINILQENSTVVVPNGGYYYIYSFLTYKSEHLTSPQIINHYVYRENKHLPRTSRQVVLTDKQMRLTGHLTYQRSFLSSVLKLSKDDAISVNVTNITAVYKFTMANFFGLFYVGP